MVKFIIESLIAVAVEIRRVVQVAASVSSLVEVNSVTQG